MAGRAGGPRRVSRHDETYQVLWAYVGDVAREFGDRASLHASTMRAYNLFGRAGMPRDHFVSHLYTARSITKERSGDIRTGDLRTGDIPDRAGEGGVGLPVKAKMAFFFAVLEDLLGLRDPDASGSTPAAGARGAD